MDNKTISDPESIQRPLDLYAIKSVSYDEANRMYTIEATDPNVNFKLLQLHVKLNSNNEIFYVKKATQYRGKRHGGITFFTTYTNDLAAIEFSVNSNRMKENLMLSDDSDECLKQMNELYDADYVKQDTKVEMRNGYFS